MRSNAYCGNLLWQSSLTLQTWFINPIVALFMPSGEWHFQYDLEDYRKKIREISQAEWTSKEQIEENILKSILKRLMIECGLCVAILIQKHKGYQKI